MISTCQGINYHFLLDDLHSKNHPIHLDMEFPMKQDSSIRIRYSYFVSY